MKHPEKKRLLQHFKSRPGRRGPAVIGNKLLLPKVFDEKEEVRETWVSPDSYYSLTLKQARFLEAFDKSGDMDQACLAASWTIDQGTRFLKKHKDAGGYFWELSKMRQLARVATPEWTKAKAVEGITGQWRPENPKVALKCLEIVKDINYPKASLTIQNNTILQMPALRPDQEEAFRALADQLADQDLQEAKLV